MVEISNSVLVNFSKIDEGEGDGLVSPTPSPFWIKNVVSFDMLNSDYFTEKFSNFQNVDQNHDFEIAPFFSAAHVYDILTSAS